MLLPQFTPEGGDIVVRAERVDLDGEPFVRVAVRDSGIGLSEEGLKRLFRPFRRGGGAWGCCACYCS